MWYQTNVECRCSLKPTLGSEHAIDAITILLSNCMNSDDVYRNVLHWEKFNTREMKVRIEAVRFSLQLEVQIENFAFLNELS